MRVVWVIVGVGIASRLGAAPTVGLELVTGSVTNPVYVTHAGDGSGRLFIVEQAGRIKIFDGTQLLPTPYLNITGLVQSGGEQGLLSVAFHPGYATNGWLYVYYTNLAGDLAIVRYAVSADPNLVDTNSATILLTIPHPTESNHNGGQLQFGPDGYLYLATGDGGSGCDPPNNAQNPASLLGKLIRLDVNAPAPAPEIRALGLRNPWRFSFDRLTGDLFLGDVGQGTREEIDFLPAGSPAGVNFGWKCIEGSVTNTCGLACPGIVAVPPVIEYNRPAPRSVTGGYRYRGHRIYPLRGQYVYADYYGGPVARANATWQTNSLLNAGFNVSSFGEDEAGELYVCRHSTTAGAIYRLHWKDTDSDGMPDDWETDHGLNPGNPADAGLDPDGDGFTNAEEFVADTDPQDQASALRVVSVTANGAGVTLGFTTSSNKLYRVRRRPDLTVGDWTTVSNRVAGTGGVVVVGDPGATNFPAHVYRIEVEP